MGLWYVLFIYIYVVGILLTFYLDTIGVNYGVRVKVGVRTVVFATAVPIKVSGLE